MQKDKFCGDNSFHSLPVNVPYNEQKQGKCIFYDMLTFEIWKVSFFVIPLQGEK